MLKRTRETALQAYAHQDVPFEQLVEELNPERSLSHSPLFQVVFGLQNAPFEALELPGLAMQPLDAGAEEDRGEGAPEGTARFDLTLSVQESADGLVGELEYNTDLFDRSTIRRLLGHYTRLLEAIVAAPQARLSRLDFLGAGRAAAAAGVERDGAFVSARAVHSRAVRGAGATGSPMRWRWCRREARSRTRS